MVAALSPKGMLAPVALDVVLERTTARQPLGMRLGPNGEVRAVRPGSPAAVAGVFRGARVVMVDGVAVASFDEAKKVDLGAWSVRVRLECNGSGWLRGRVAERAEGEVGGITPDVPMLLPPCALTGVPARSVYVGDVVLAAAGVDAAPAPAIGAAVLFRACCAGGRVVAVDVKVDPDAPVVARPVHFHTEKGPVAFAAGMEKGTLLFAKGGAQRPALRRVAFDGDSAVRFPELGYWEGGVQLPAAQRETLLRQLRALAAAAGVAHNIPEAPAPRPWAAPSDLMVYERPGGEVMPCRGRRDAAMLEETASNLWVGWLDPALADEPREAVVADVTSFLAGHAVQEVRPVVRGGRVAAAVTLACPVTQAQFAELNSRLYRGRWRVSVDANPRGGDSYALCRSEQCARHALRRTEEELAAQLVEQETTARAKVLAQVVQAGWAHLKAAANEAALASIARAEAQARQRVVKDAQFGADRLLRSAAFCVPRKAAQLARAPFNQLERGERNARMDIEGDERRARRYFGEEMKVIRVEWVREKRMAARQALRAAEEDCLSTEGSSAGTEDIEVPVAA